MYETVWSFETARFTVNLGVAPEDLNPAGHFDEQWWLALVPGPSPGRFPRYRQP